MTPETFILSKFAPEMAARLIQPWTDLRADALRACPPDRLIALPLEDRPSSVLELRDRLERSTGQAWTPYLILAASLATSQPLVGINDQGRYAEMQAVYFDPEVPLTTRPSVAQWDWLTSHPEDRRHDSRRPIMVEMRQRGENDTAIARHLGMRPAEVRSHLTNWPKRDERERMAAMRAEGHTNAEIARACGVSPQTVYNRLGPIYTKDQSEAIRAEYLAVEEETEEYLAVEHNLPVERIRQILGARRVR